MIGEIIYVVLFSFLLSDASELSEIVILPNYSPKLI